MDKDLIMYIYGSFGIGGVVLFAIVLLVLKLIWENYKEDLIKKIENRIDKKAIIAVKASYNKYIKPLKKKEILADGKIDEEEKKEIQKAAKNFAIDLVVRNIKNYTPSWFYKLFGGFIEEEVGANIEGKLFDIQQEGKLKTMILDSQKKTDFQSTGT